MENKTKKQLEREWKETSKLVKAISEDFGPVMDKTIGFWEKRQISYTSVLALNHFNIEFEIKIENFQKYEKKSWDEKKVEALEKFKEYLRHSDILGAVNNFNKIEGKRIHSI